MSIEGANPTPTYVENKKRSISCLSVGLIILLVLIVIVIIIVLLSPIIASVRMEIELIASGCPVSYHIGNTSIYRGLVISEDGKLLAALDSTKLMIVESETGKIITQTELNPLKRSNPAISPDGKYAAVAQWGERKGSDWEYMGDEIIILNIESGVTLAVGEDEGYDIGDEEDNPFTPTTNELFSPNNKEFLFTAIINSIYGIYKLNLDSETIELLLPASDLLFFTPDGKIMVTEGNEGIQLWNFQDGIPSLIQEIPVPGPIEAAALSPDGKKLAVATGRLEDAKISFVVTIWNIPSGEFDREIKKGYEGSAPRLLSFSPDSELLAVVECEGKLYRISDGAIIKTVNRIGRYGNSIWDHPGCVSNVVFSPEGEVYYYGSNWHLAECLVPPY